MNEWDYEGALRFEQWMREEDERMKNYKEIKVEKKIIKELQLKLF